MNLKSDNQRDFIVLLATLRQAPSERIMPLYLKPNTPWALLPAHIFRRHAYKKLLISKIFVLFNLITHNFQPISEACTALAGF
jgi:hypothetical protein